MSLKSDKSRYRDSGGNLRLPPAHEGLQVNSCRNPACSGFGVEALTQVDRGRPKSDGSSKLDHYRANGTDGNTADQKLFCKLCGKTSPIKSNRAIQEERTRISGYLEPVPEPSCPNADCQHATKGVFSHPVSYSCHAKLKSSQRLKCRSCGIAFSIATKATHGQRKPHENKTVFAEIVSKKSIRGICKVTGLTPKAVYDKTDFIYEQCRRFVGAREAKAHRINRKYVRLCTDRQDYLINWKTKRRRKNVQFTSTCTVEGMSGYVLGHHLNYDPFVNQIEIDDTARMNGDGLQGARSYFSAQPQYWKSDEFYAVARMQETDIRPSLEEGELTVEERIASKSRMERNYPKQEMADYPAKENQLPPDGAMTHLDYTSYAHALLVRRLIGNPGYLTIYSDQDEVLRGAFTAAFSWQISQGKAEMAYVQFQKRMNIDEKLALSNISRGRIARMGKEWACHPEKAIARHMAWEYAELCARHQDWRNRWVPHPKDTVNEPRRRIQYLTDTGRKSLLNIGWTLSGASLAPVDTYFMQIRRQLYYLERPIPTQTNAEKLYYGYSAYDPLRVVQHLEIFRVFSNYVWTDSNGMTPAMKFGLAKGPVRMEDILYYWPF